LISESANFWLTNLLMVLSCTGLEATSRHMSRQWRNKVAVGPRASIPKGLPLPPKNLKKQHRANFGPPHSAGPACTARLARPIVTPL